MADVSLQNMRTTGQISRDVCEIIQKLLNALIKAEQERRAMAAINNFNESFKNGAEVYMYQLADTSSSAIAEFKKLCNERNLTLIENQFSPPGQFFVICDADQIRQMRECEYDVLSKTAYFQEAPMSALDNINKDAFKLCGLDENTLEVFKNKCNSLGSVVTLYTDPQVVRDENGNPILDDNNRYIPLDKTADGSPKYDVAIRLDQMEKGKKSDVYCALLETAFSIHGANSQIKNEQIEYDKMIDTRVWEAIASNVDHALYLTNYVEKDEHGNFKGNKYCMEVSADRVTIFAISPENRAKDGVIEPGYTLYTDTSRSEIMSCRKDDPSFCAFVAKWLDRMEDKEIFNSASDVLATAALNNTQIRKEYYERIEKKLARPQKTYNQKVISKVQSAVAQHMSKMIHKRGVDFTTEDPTMPGKIDAFMADAKRLLSCMDDSLSNEEISKRLKNTGFTVSDIENLRAVAEQTARDFCAKRDISDAEKDDIVFTALHAVDKSYKDVLASIEEIPKTEYRGAKALNEKEKQQFRKEAEQYTTYSQSVKREYSTDSKSER